VRAPPSFDQLKRLFRYEPATGKLFWLPRTPDMFRDGRQTAAHSCARWNARYADRQVPDHDNGAGYMTVALSGRPVKVHRVALALHLGRDLVGEVDHINGDRADNTAANLREVTRTENMRNKRRYRNSTSGITGVHYRARDDRWVAHLGRRGKAVHIGQFVTREEAVIARQIAVAAAGFAAFHGRSG